MTRREKTILAVMGVAVLYGLYDTVASRLSRSEIRLDPGLTSLCDGSIEAIHSSALAPVEKHVLAAVDREWASNPLKQRAVTSAPERRDSPVAYTGYIEAAGVRMAIVNGMECAVGDKVVSGRYAVERIEPDEVLLRDTLESKQITVRIEAQLAD